MPDVSVKNVVYSDRDTRPVESLDRLVLEHVVIKERSWKYTGRAVEPEVEPIHYQTLTAKMEAQKHLVVAAVGNLGRRRAPVAVREQRAENQLAEARGRETRKRYLEWAAADGEDSSGAGSSSGSSCSDGCLSCPSSASE